MTDYRIPPTTNLWTDDNASLMEAFMSSSDLTSFWAAPPAQPTPQPAHAPVQPQSSASTSDYPKPPVAAQFQPSVTPLNQETLMQRLQALIEGARESWTYAIFWQSSYDYSGAAVLGWGEGFYKDERDKVKTKAKTTTSAAEQEYRKKVLRDLNSLISGADTSADDAVVDQEVTDTEWFFLVSMAQSFVNGGGLPGQAFFHSTPVWVAGPDRLAASPCERARQGQVFGLQTMVCVPTANGVVELGSAELIYQSSDLMNKVRVLFDFNNLEVGSWPMSGGATADQGENDPSSLWLNDPSTTTMEVKDPVRKFDSGVMVIQNKSHSDEEVFARIKTLVTKPDALRTGISASDAAITLGIAPGMAKEHLLSAESKGLLCRDISPDGFRFYINLFPEIDPNDLYLVKDYGTYHTWLRAASASG